jgi:hypothetical protein
LWLFFCLGITSIFTVNSMMKRYLYICFVLLTALYINACKKEVKSTNICLHDSSIDYMKRWAILTTQTDVFETNGAVKSRTVIHPNGFFQINSDFTYNLFSDDAPVNGKWNINKTCDFVLNPNTAKERRFLVITLSDDSLTLRQTSGLTSVTQRYAAFKCPSLASLEFRWDNAFTLRAPYSTDTVFKAIRSKQSGYFKLNADASYNLILGAFNGVPAPPPATGTWGIAQPGCLLVLDKNKTDERSYEVQKLTADSLVIWRKDTVIKQNFLQHFFKHK